MFTHVSEEHPASIFAVEEYAKEASNNKQAACRALRREPVLMLVLFVGTDTVTLFLTWPEFVRT
jgi:hypothetical protein